MDFRRTLSASSLDGTDVYNTAGEKLGHIKEVMVDIIDGDIAYGVLSFGGLLGVGDKLFAIPWKAMQINEADERIVLPVPKERLEDAPGFDKDNWPDFGNEAFRSQLETHYASYY